MSSILVSIESAYATSYQSLIVTMDVSPTVFEILAIKARKLLVFPTPLFPCGGTLCDINVIYTLLKLVSIESSQATSYQSLIVTLAVSATVFEILTLKASTESIQKRAIYVYFFPSHVKFPTDTQRLLLIFAFQTLRHFKVNSFKTFATHLPAFTTSSHPHATLLFYPGSEQSVLSHAYPSVLKSIAPSLYTH